MKKINPSKVGLIIRNNYIINRSVPLILLIVMLVLGAIVAAIPVSQVNTMYYGEQYFEVNIEAYNSYKDEMTIIFNKLTHSDGVFSMILMCAALVLPILLALSSCGFMRERSGNDFYHSLSVNRAELFIANYITVFANTAITLIASQLCGIIFMSFMAKYAPMSFAELLTTQLPVVGVSILFTAIFTAIAMIATVAAGSVFASLINYLFINFYIPLAVLCVAGAGSTLFGTSLMDYTAHFPGIYCYTSPFLRYVFGIFDGFKIKPLEYALMPIAAIALVALGIFIYSKKKNENASKPLPFKVSVRPLQYLITFVAMLLGTMLFEAITNSMTWGFVGMLLALFFGFIAFNAFVNKSFAGVFKNSRHMLYMLVAALLLGAVFVADVFNIYKEPKPDLDRISEVSLYVTNKHDTYEDWINYSFDKDASSTAWDEDITLDENAAELSAELYALVKSKNSRSYAWSNEDEAVRISMSVFCEGDLSSYHAYATIAPSDPEWERVNEILAALKQSYKTNSQGTYHYETTEAAEVY